MDAGVCWRINNLQIFLASAQESEIFEPFEFEKFFNLVVRKLWVYGAFIQLRFKYALISVNDILHVDDKIRELLKCDSSRIFLVNKLKQIPHGLNDKIILRVILLSLKHNIQHDGRKLW